MSDSIRIVLAGIGGYGSCYVRALLDSAEKHGAVLGGVVDPRPAACPCLPELQARNTACYPSLEAFYEADRADLAIIASPIQFHCPDTCLTVANQSHVLCEKPAAATVPEVRTMRAARDRAGRSVSIGYQWSFTEPVLRLKADILAGMFGRPRLLKTLVLWPRDTRYFARNTWAGRRRDPQGRWVMDSVANNATAHYLHNMFFVLGTEGQSALPVRVQAELYRANSIENFDTVATRAWTAAGTELVFLATHAVQEQRGPLFEYRFDRAAVRYGDDPRGIVASFDDGSERVYGDPERGAFEQKLWGAVDAVRQGRPTPCGLEAAFGQTLCIHGIQTSSPNIHDFDQSLIQTVGDQPLVCVKGLGDLLAACYQEARLPSERGVAWAHPGIDVALNGWNTPGFELTTPGMA